MAKLSLHSQPTAIAAAALLACCAAWPAAAQTTPTPTPTITVTGRGERPLGVGGFDTPISALPMQGAAFSEAQLRDAGVTSLADLTLLEAALSDAYNAPGYWSSLTARGFVLDQRRNYRRDGLPINAETALALENKERVEVLLGISGMQAGTSAPGGLVDLVVKRPTAKLRSAFVEVADRGSLAAHVDLAERFGAEGRFGARLNVAGARLRPQLRDAKGERSLFALALDWRIAADSLLEFEVERSRQSQPSVPGFSLLGDRLPPAASIDPRTNLNNQPWSLPVVLAGDTASLRWRQRLAGDWTLAAHGATQRLRSDDRVAFPFGCTAANGDYYGDRYCPDGTFDLWDFRSEGERRRSDALDLRVEGGVRAGGLSHRVTAGVLLTRNEDRFGRQANNFAGSGRIDASAVTPPKPMPGDENTDRDEKSREVYVRDALTLSPQWALWTGLRHTRLDRRSVRTDGSRPTAYGQSFTTPWLAVSYTPLAGAMVYASWGQGVESEVVPNRSFYDNGGAALPALKSRQLEAGVKLQREHHAIALAVFDIRRPVARDFCDDAGARCIRRTDGVARHRGVEASLEARDGAWTARAAGQWLDARNAGSSMAGVNGLRPTNVPRQSLRLQIGYDFAPAAGVQATLAHEGRRAVLPDNSVWLPAWSRLDLAAQWRTKLADQDVRWRAGIENVTNRRAWRESPYQFSHVYLYPLAPRSWRVSASTSF